MTVASLPAVAASPATAGALPDITTLADRLPAGTLLLTTTPPLTALAPPERPVPAPRDDRDTVEDAPPDDGAHPVGVRRAGDRVGSEGTFASSPRSPCGCARPTWRSTPAPGSSTPSSPPVRPSRPSPAPASSSALELLDRHCLTAVNDWKNRPG